jgi:hypothetical protein
MWWSIGLISLIDLYLALKFLDPEDISSLRQTEENPLVVQLIEYSGDLSLFTVVKIVGTLAALLVCKKMYDINKPIGLAVCGGVCLFQLCLLMYLLCW